MGEASASAPDHDIARVLSIGAVFGGPRSPWKEPIGELTKRVATLREGIESPLNVNIVFHVPGSVSSPKWEGIRTGSFRKLDSHLMVQVSLPAVVPADPQAYLRSRAVAAVDEVESWATRRSTGMDLTAVHELVRRV